MDVELVSGNCAYAEFTVTTVYEDSNSAGVGSVTYGDGSVVTCYGADECSSCGTE